ncbi:hypothetical protein I2I11_11135 [Pontibacter sp. 172403-2]|uniref:HpcH/HpaI aldolase/citrate lyase family protein n=1 Tax=Pontibacter rufus TaxID=2791028 RepID=UPI0018AFF48C|nr:aldolase/citrate lyase family protein [Pontibacter sp. 172403-2]MBF9253847.1 hypothetical protein [Pontibacter sp. 172403-2]
MRSYFFIPGTRYSNLEFIRNQGVDEIIIDLEDAVKGSERAEIINTLLRSTNVNEFWLRVPLRESFEQQIDGGVLKLLLEKGFSKIVLPKLLSAEEFNSLVTGLDINSNHQFIVLVEHPRMLIDLDSMLFNANGQIKGVGLGSHDLVSILGAKHTLKNLEYPRQKLLYSAKAAEVDCIDIASMELQDQTLFKEELADGFEKGYDAKFLIHPWQLEIFNTFDYFSEEEVQWAAVVMDAYSKAGENLEFSPIVIGNEVIERPHIKRAKIITEKGKGNARK